VVASRAIEEWAQLERECDVQREKLRRVIDQEMAVAWREKAAILKDLEVEQKERAARHTIDNAKAVAKMIDEERADLQQRELAIQEEKAHLAARLVDMEVQARDFREREVAVQEKEAKVEGLLAERVVKWVGEANSTLDTLGLSPIQVPEARSSLGAVLPVLDSAAERLQHLESTVVGRLETEGQEVARVVVEYVLTYFRSHDPAIPLTPVLVGPIPEMVAAAREGVQEAVEIVAARIEHFIGPDLQTGGPPRTANRIGVVFYIYCK
jgi:hypothetical protein